MTAGRKLDALVAEKVMGQDMTPPEGFEYPIGLPYYSADIVAAWGVVGKLRSTRIANNDSLGDEGPYDHWTFQLQLSNDAQQWKAVFILSDPYYSEAAASTASLAICHAALKAVGAEVPS